MPRLKRNQLYDTVRGVAILLVVLGHGIQYGINDYDNHILFRIIYSFHMPLFMFVSGIVVPLGSKINLEWLKKKFCQLVIPFLTWIVLPFIFDENRDWIEFGKKIWNIIQSPDRGGLWFLWVLFLNCCALYVGIKICEKIGSKNEIVILLCECIVIFLFSRMITGWFGLGSCAYYCVYYFAGYLLGKYKNQIEVSERTINILQILGSVVYIVLIPMWRRTQLPMFLQVYETQISSMILEMLGLIYKYITAFCGILATWLLCKVVLVKCHVISESVGRYTLEIYALHYFFITIFPLRENMLGVFVNSMVSLGLSLVITQIIERGQVAELLFGKKSRSKQEW